MKQTIQTIQAPRPLRPSMNLTTTRPTRELFLRHYVSELRAHGYARETATARRTALSWFLAAERCAPHEVTQAHFESFVDRLRRIGVKESRVESLERAIISAFDEMCAKPIAHPMKEPVHPLSPHHRLIQVLAQEVGLEPREIARLRWDEINFDEQLMHGASSSRRIALTKRAADLLGMQKKATPSAAAFVFPSARRAGHVTVR